MSSRDTLRADSDTLGRLQFTLSEGLWRWHYDTLSSPHLLPSPFTICDDYGPQELLEHAASAGAAEPS